MVVVQEIAVGGTKFGVGRGESLTLSQSRKKKLLCFQVFCPQNGDAVVNIFNLVLLQAMRKRSDVW